MKFLENALEGKNDWWRYLLIIFISLVGANIIGSIPLLIVMTNYSSENIYSINELISLGMDSNVLLLLMIIPFVIGLILLFLMFSSIHKRKRISLINGEKSIRWKRIFVSAGIYFVLSSISFLVSYLLNPQDFILQFDIYKFLPLLVIVLLFIPLQTSFEELLFRSYLSQAVSVATRNRILAILIPAIMFALMHLLNPEVEEYGFWLVMPQYLFFGLVFGLISILDDGIELAIGAHAMNNIFASLFVTYESSVLQTSAVFELIKLNPEIELVNMIIVLSIFVMILSYIYKLNYKLLFKSVKNKNNA